MPYINQVKVAMYLPSTQNCLLLMDSLASHWTHDVIALLKQLHVCAVRVPEHHTPYLQPLDMTVNQSFKSHFWTCLKTDCHHPVGHNATMKAKNKRLVALYNAWQTVPDSCVKNSWKATGLDQIGEGQTY